MRWARLAADATAAIVGFAIFFAVNAGWANLIRSLDLPTFEFGLPELAIAVGFGVFGAIIGTVFKLSTVGTQKLAAPLAGRPVLRCTGVGLILGLVGMALPLTLFPVSYTHLADNYVLQFRRPLEEPLRSLVIAGAVALDTAFRQK